MFAEGEEPVDAYGTPRTLVDALRRERAERAAGAELELEREEGFDGALDRAPVAARDDKSARAESALDDPTDDDHEVAGAIADETDDADLEDANDDETNDEALEGASDDETDDEDLEEASDDEMDDDHLEDAVGDATVEADTALELAETDVDASPERDDAIAREDEVGEVGDEIPREHELIPVAKAKTPELQSKAAPSKSSPRSRNREPEPDREGPLVELMDKTRSAETADAPVASGATAARETRTEGERELVLQPRAVAREKTIKPQPVLGERAQLLRDAGCLFVDRGRVAVSMLQRQYGMDFDEACKVLDELQDLGLIGPYLGGQHRDILLTRDQWLEKVGGA
jgi:hypothetical protein